MCRMLTLQNYKGQKENAFDQVFFLLTKLIAQYVELNYIFSYKI